MTLERDTVAIPFAAGVTPSTRARLLEPQKLQVAENCYFELEQGPQKRLGYTPRRVKTPDPYPPPLGVFEPVDLPVRALYSTADPGLSPDWVFGWGPFTENRTGEVGSTTSLTVPYEVSPHPDAGLVAGVATRDDELLAWDGHRVFSASGAQGGFAVTQDGVTEAASRGPAVMPMLRAEPVAKVATSQVAPDAADNGVLRVAAWVAESGVAAFSAFDSVNGATMRANAPGQAAVSVRVISVGAWFHVFSCDPVAGLHMTSFHQESPASVTTRSLGTCDKQFDVKKIDEHEFVVVKTKTGVMTVFVLNEDGSTATSFTADTDGHPPGVDRAVACEIDKTGDIGIVWQDGATPATVYFSAFNQAGLRQAVGFAQVVTTVAAPSRMTIAPKYITPVNELTEFDNFEGAWEVYVEDTVTGVKQVRCHHFTNDVQTALIATRWRAVLASHAFRVGDRTFAWLAPWFTGTPALQYTWFLCDAGLKPVGKHAYGQAAVDIGATRNTLPSVNWHVDTDAHPYKDRVVYHGALPFNLRVDVAQTTQFPSKFTPSGVFAETSISFYELDFLPPLRWGQAGRCTYFAGAQLWAYDGQEVVEGVFHLAPEGVTVAAAAGGACAAGVYRVRVDLCHKNAQNEEVRSWSLISNPVTAAANDKLTVTIPTVPFTRREDAYFLVFVTEANGTVFYLSSSRDPTAVTFVPNDLGTTAASHVHLVSDATLRVREYHPANAGGNYLDPLPAPACEVVAAGRDRLFLAGGELAPGEVAPSRLFPPGVTPAFSPGLNIQVDRNAEPITAVGFLGEIGVIFRRTSTYILDGDGPDNTLNGTWPPPRLAVADTGAVGPEGLALTTVGLWFQSPAGLRLLGNSGTMDRAAGMEMDPVVSGAVFAGAVVVPQFTQVRWYSRDPARPTLVVDYSSGNWCTWTVHGVGAVFWPVTQLAAAGRGEDLWVETPGVYLDAGNPYEMRVRTAWLRAKGLGDFQRLRRWALFGESAGAHTLRTRVFYDERRFHEEEFQDVVVRNTSTWGGGTWGGGTWGDVSGGTSDLEFVDDVFRIRHRPHRQKCSVFALEFSDQGAATAGFIPVVLALELGVKPGLDRIPR